MPSANERRGKIRSCHRDLVSTSSLKPEGCLVLGRRQEILDDSFPCNTPV